MITPKQQKWLEHLSNEKKIIISPYDPTCEEKFQSIKQIIHKHLGQTIRVEHHGASSLGILGQDEIDVYVPVDPSDFNLFIPKMEKIFGEKRSIYPMERVRFSTEIEGKKIDLFLINEKSEGWLSGLKFENYLKKHPTDLEKYRKLKEQGNGLSVRKYYTIKNEFINSILEKAKLGTAHQP